MPNFMQKSLRIVGGQNAPSMIPWQVAIFKDTNFICGGTILDECTILTAASCNIIWLFSGYFIRAGSTDKISGGQVNSQFYKLVLKNLTMFMIKDKEHFQSNIKYCFAIR